MAAYFSPHIWETFLNVTHVINICMESFYTALIVSTFNHVEKILTHFCNTTFYHFDKKILFSWLILSCFFDNWWNIINSSNLCIFLDIYIYLHLNNLWQ